METVSSYGRSRVASGECKGGNTGYRTVVGRRASIAWSYITVSGRRDEEIVLDYDK